MSDLREMIAQEIGEWRWKDSFYGEYITENDRNSCRAEAGLVFDLIKEAGFVELAEDQTTPNGIINLGDWTPEDVEYETKDRMLTPKDGTVWRKIKEGIK